MDVPRLVVGCDPGPEFCAYALVAREGSRLVLSTVQYICVSELLRPFQPRPTPDERARPEFNRVFGGLLGDKFVFAFEKMTTRYGAIPGATVFDTCRNSGVCLASAVSYGAVHVYAISPSDWRLAFCGASNATDAATRAALIECFGSGAEGAIQAESKRAKTAYGLSKPVTSHLRDAVGVAAGLFLLKRRGCDPATRVVWGA